MSTIKTVIPAKEQQLNQAVSGVISHLQEEPEEAQATFSVRSKLEEGFLSRIEARDFKLLSDEPEDLGGSNLGPNPVEYVLGALAACQEIVIKAHAGQLGINLTSVRVEAEGDIDLRGFFNVADEARAGFNKVRYHTVIETEETDAEKLKKLKDLSLNRCPVLDIIQNPVEVDGTVSYVN